MSKLVIGNLKSNLVIGDLNRYLKEINTINNKDIVICPSSLFVPYFMKQGYSVGIQNIGVHDNGAYTGEISAQQASSIGIKYALIGHGEVRQNLNEDDQIINKKIKKCLDNNVTPILCVGETLEEKDMMKTEKILKKQLVNGLRNIDNLNSVIIAYCPIWSIDSNKTLPVKDIEEIVDFIKNIVSLNCKYDNIRVVYGGGITDKNIDKIIKIDSLSGYLIGSISVDVNKFMKIIEVAVG